MSLKLIIGVYNTSPNIIKLEVELFWEKGGDKQIFERSNKKSCMWYD